MEAEPDRRLLEAKGLSKKFPGVQALDDVDLTLHKGEVHALLGGNGAGKSTLIRILGGIETPDAGTLRLEGKDLPRGDIAGSLAAGIRIIHQEIALSPNLSVGENIFLGSEPRRIPGIILRNDIHHRAQEVLDDLGFPLASRDRVGDLSVGRRQLVEIARALCRRPRVLILDEPTAALDANETERLFEEIEKLRGRGIGIIYITHRLEEVFRIADRVTVLRDGRSVLARGVEGLREEEVVESLVGRKLERRERAPRAPTGVPLLEARGISTPVLDRIGFTLRRGEVLGLAGQMGSGRSELARALAGVDPIGEGDVVLEGKPLDLRSPRAAIRAGIVLVPEDRRHQGLFPRQDVRFNLTLPDIASWLRMGRLDARRRRALCERSMSSLRIAARPTDQEVRFLSGGNQQKVVIGKWLGELRKVVVLDDPARGVDVAAKEEIFAIVDRLAADGLGVIFISSEVAEVLRVSDRILVLRQGRVHAAVEKGAAGEEDIVRLAAGHSLPARAGGESS